MALIDNRYIRILIYNADRTAVAYDSNDSDRTWGIDAGTIEVEQYLMDEELRYGGSNSAKVTMKIYGINENLEGRFMQFGVWGESKVYNELINSDNENVINSEGENIITSTGQVIDRVSVINGYIVECVEDAVGGDYIITMYDKMYTNRDNDVADWWNTYITNNATINLRSFISALCATQTGMAPYSVSHIPNTITFSHLKEVYGDSVTSIKFGDLLSMACEIACVSPVVIESYLRLIRLDTSSVIDLTGNIEKLDTTFEKYETETIDGVAFYGSTSELLYATPDATNMYKVTGNLLLNACSASELEAIADYMTAHLSTITYTPAHIKMVEGLPNSFANIGSYLKVQDKYCFMNHIRMYGSLLIEEEVECKAKGPTLGNDIYNPYGDIVSAQKISKVARDLDSVTIEVSSLERAGGVVYDIKSYSASDNVLTIKIQAGGTFKAMENNQTVSLGVRFTSNITGYDSYTKQLEISYGSPTTTLTVPIKYDTANLTNQVSLYKNQVLYLKLSRNGSGVYTCVVTTDTTSSTMIKATSDELKLEVKETAQEVVDNSVSVLAITRQEYSGSGDAIRVWVVENPIGLTYSNVQHYGFRFGIKCPGTTSIDADKPKYLRIIFDDGANEIFEPIYLDNAIVTNQLTSQDIVYLVHDSRTVGTSTFTGFHTMTDKYSQAQIDIAKNQIVLKVNNQGKLVTVALSADPSTGSVFDIYADKITMNASHKLSLVTDSFEIDSTYFKVSATGVITATSGTIGGWTITAGKIYGGDGTTNNEVAVMQKPASNINWVFAAGGDSHSSYASCPFKVSKNGSLFTKYININDGTSNQTSRSCAYLGWDEQDDCINVLFRNSNGNNVLGINGDTGRISASGNITSVNGTISSFGSMQVGDNTANSSRGYVIQTNGGGVASFGLDTNGECGITRLAGTTINYIVYRLSSGNVRLGDGGGYVDTSGVWHNGSSIKIKKNIEAITDKEALKILDLRPVKFDFKQSETDNQNESGFIAEEVEKIYPKIVGEESGTEGESDYLPKSLKYTDFIPYMIKLLQMQQEEIDKLKGE